MLLLCKGIEEELGADGLFGLLAGLGVELLAGRALGLKKLGERVLVVRHLAQELVQLVVRLLLHNGLRQGELGLRQGRLEHLVADLRGLLGLLRLLELGLGGLAQLLDGVKLGSHLRELVVKLRQDALLGLLHVDLDGCFLTLVLAVLDGCGELGILAGLQALDCLVEALDEVVGANLVGQALGGSLVDGLAVDLGGQVDDGEVTLLQLAGGVLQLAEAGAQVVELRVHGVVVNAERLDVDGDCREVRHRDLRAHVNLGGELDHVVVLDLGDVNLRLTQRGELVLFYRLLVARGEHVVDNLLEEGTAPKSGVDKLARSLAATETGDRDLLGDRLVRLVDLGAELIERNVHGQLDAGVAELIDGCFHGCLL